MGEEIEKVIVFIDGSNLYHLVKNLCPDQKQIEFNFSKFLKNIVGARTLIRVYYYNCPLDRNKDNKAYRAQQRFFEKLREMPNFKLVLCRMQKVKIGGKTIYQVKEDDIHLAVDMVKLGYNKAYDTAILVSSDGDFVPAIKAVQEIGKKVEDIGFENKFSFHLKKVCDKFVKLKKQEVENFFI
ncbi:MAG: NYN domain-containing protein [Nanoarchaeota archaeon]|nr:NYN domain-containing protein [Nanoarchaeota archaeon]